VDYRHVEMLFDMLVEYFHNKPPPEEGDSSGEWVRVRDGLQGAEHCIRVLTPEEFEDWHRCVEMPIQVEFGRIPVAFCSHEGQWWVIYSDTDESEVIAQFEKCFEGPKEERAETVAQGGSASDESAREIGRFFGISIYMLDEAAPPPRFCAAYDVEKAEFQISPLTLLKGRLSARALAMVTEWAIAHERELLDAWESCAAGREPRRIEPLR